MNFLSTLSRWGGRGPDLGAAAVRGTRPSVSSVFYIMYIIGLLAMAAVDQSPTSGLAALVEIMARLRDPETGCEWDRVQTFETIAPYTIEEAYEVADAIRRGDMDALKDELGDLQLQVVYHARMAEERGAFALDDVMASICAKMIRRHPHIFGDAAASPGWEALKAAERGADADAERARRRRPRPPRPEARREDPAPRRAGRLRLARRRGPAAQDRRGAGRDRARRDRRGARRASSATCCSRSSIMPATSTSNPETALREATARFEARFRKVEEIADKPLKDMNIDELEALWQRAKKLV